MIKAEASDARVRIAMAGAAGSHPQTIRLIHQALHGLRAATPLVIDLSGFDTRGQADYAFARGALRIDPADAGISSRFATAGPNMVISGGMHAFGRLQHLFGHMLDEHGVGVLLMCHSWGYPEQALIRAARARQITVFQIDEGPFSLPLRGTEVPETSRRLARLALGALRKARLVPPRDMTGALIDRVLVTAEGRRRQLIARGVDADQLILVPPPRFDRLADVAQEWPSRPLDEAARRVVWLHQPFRADGKVRAEEVDRAEHALASALYRVSARLPIKMIPRLHPRSDEQERKRIHTLLRERGLTLGCDGDGPLYDVLMQADAAVGFYSSALLEAAVCTMPVVAARLASEAFAQPTEAAKAEAMARLGIPVARGAGELAAILEAGLSKATRPVPPALVEQEIGWLNGGGAARVASILVDALPAAARQPTDMLNPS